MSENGLPLPSRKRKLRVDVACDFCRRRKLGCDNARPRCQNCESHSKECTYTVRGPKLVKIDSTSECARDNSHRVLASKRETSSLVHGRAAPGNHQGSDNEAPPDLSERSTPNGPKPDSNLRFHGPTSAMFDGEHPTSRTKADLSAEDMARKSQLLAETARQRQLELINLRSRKLDFDGTDPELGMKLLTIFWNRQHATGSIVYRPYFMRDMAFQGPYFSKLLINAIFFIATKDEKGSADFACSTGPCDSGRPFRQRIEELLYDPKTQLMCISSIPTIQALLLFSDALFSWCDERSLSWHYLGIAINMIIDLGIHTESSPATMRRASCFKDLEVDRRVFWAAYILDKTQSIYQGRPPRLRDIDTDVPMIFLDEFEELEPFESTGYSKSPEGCGEPTHSVTTFQQLGKLATITDHILCNFYVQKGLEKHQDELINKLALIHDELMSWRKSLPPHLALLSDNLNETNAEDGHVDLPHIICLTLMFHAKMILLHRPFTPGGHLSTSAGSSSRDASSVCESAAEDIDGILRYYKTHWPINTPPYFLSYATYVSGTIHARTAAEHPPGSKHHKYLQNCIDILSQHQNVCHAPRRCLEILLGLAKRLGVNVGDEISAPAPSSCHLTSTLRGQSDLLSGVDPPVPTWLSADRSQQANSSDLIPEVATNEGIPQPSADAADSSKATPAFTLPLVENSAMQDSGEGLESWLPGISFDMDPLFGFNTFSFETCNN